MPNPTNPLSDCCKAPLKVSSGDEGTSCYICTKCNEICDQYVPTNPNEAEDAEQQALRDKLFEIMNRRNEKILAAQKTDALILPYFKADNDAADEILELFESQHQKWLKEVESKIPRLKIHDGTESESTKFYYQGFNEVVAAWRAALRGKSDE